MIVREVIGGSGEIRTHGRRKPSLVFKTSALNHSATLPTRPRIIRGWGNVSSTIGETRKNTFLNQYVANSFNGFQVISRNQINQPLTPFLFINFGQILPFNPLILLVPTQGLRKRFSALFCSTRHSKQQAEKSTLTKPPEDR